MRCWQGRTRLAAYLDQQMFRKLRDNRGQGIIVEYALTFFLVVAVVTAMSMYFRRTVQGRVRDSIIYMANSVSQEYPGNVWVQYEPYYLNTDTRRQFYSEETSYLLPSFPTPSGIFEVNYNQTTTAQSYGEQAPPRAAQ